MPSVSRSSNQHAPPASSEHVVENILRDFLKYLYSVQDRYALDDYNIIEDNQKSSHNSQLIDWSPMEAEKHHNQLKFFGRALGEQMHRLPRENSVVRGILDTMKAAIREGMQQPQTTTTTTTTTKTNDDTEVNNVHHVMVLIETVSKLLHVVNPVDLERLIWLMKKNQAAGNTLEEKDVILLCGATGAGKTTTLHYLAGTTFREEEVDGFFHLQPKGYADPTVARYQTSCGRDAMTHSLQTTSVHIDGKELVLCDTPGLTGDRGGASRDVEEDIANGLGIVRAIHRANTVRPILVLSREGMGDRFTAFSETLSSVTRLIGNSEHVDLKPFNYIFTKYEKRHRTCMCRQFILIRKRPRPEEEGKALFKSFVDDIIQKTTPEAKIALPMEGSPQELLRGILKDRFIVTDPKQYFVPFVSDSALRKLKLQLQITLRDVMSALVEEDYTLAVYRMQQLCNLALVLPEATECAQLALEATMRHVMAAREKVIKIVEQVQTVKIHKQFTQLLEAYKVEVRKVMASEQIRHVCAIFERDSNARRRKVPGTNESFSIEQINNLLKLVSRDIPEFEPELLNTEVLMKKRGSFLTGVVRLKEMSELLCNIPGDHFVASMYMKAFDIFYSFVDRVLSEAEQSFQTTPTRDMHSFERQAWFLAVLIQGFLNKPDTGTGEHVKMEELENRRLKLMLRLEIKISDTIELITNTRFPDCSSTSEGGEPSTLPIVKLSGLQGPRHLLLSVAQLPRLCKFLPSKIDPQEAEKTVAVMDQKVVFFIDGVVMQAESILYALQDKASTREDDIALLLSAATSFRVDLHQVIEELSGVRQWSADLREQMVGSWSRLLQVRDHLHALMERMDDALQKQQSLGFACGALPSSYFCGSRS